MFTEIRTQRDTGPVMSDLGEGDRQSTSSWEPKETALLRGRRFQLHKCFTLNTDEKDQPAAERAGRRSGVELRRVGRTVEPVQRESKR